MSEGRTAGLLVEVARGDQLGKVQITVENVGPETLSPKETIILLRQALGLMELQEAWRAVGGGGSPNPPAQT